MLKRTLRRRHAQQGMLLLVAIVAAIVVTYRGLDTLGEVTVLFLTAAIVGLVLALTVQVIEQPLWRVTAMTLVSFSSP